GTTPALSMILACQPVPWGHFPRDTQAPGTGDWLRHRESGFARSIPGRAIMRATRLHSDPGSLVGASSIDAAPRPERPLGVANVPSHHCPPGGGIHHEEAGMPSVPSRNRPAIRSPHAAYVILALLLAAGCGPSTGGNLAEVDAKQQKELNKLLT